MRLPLGMIASRTASSCGASRQRWLQDGSAECSVARCTCGWHGGGNQADSNVLRERSVRGGPLSASKQYGASGYFAASAKCMPFQHGRVLSTVVVVVVGFIRQTSKGWIRSIHLGVTTMGEASPELGSGSAKRIPDPARLPRLLT